MAQRDIEEYPQECSSFLSIDMPYLDKLSTESLTRDQPYIVNVISASTEDLTVPTFKRSPCLTRQITRTRSVDRYRTERRSTRSIPSGSTRRPRHASSMKCQRTSSLRPSEILLMPHNLRRPSGRLTPTSDNPRPGSSLSEIIARKERRRRRIVLIIMISFLVLVIASVLVVVVTLTHSSVINVHNVTSKYYTFSAPPHHPLIRQENERIMHESLNIGTANMSQPTAAQRVGVNPH